MDLTTVTPLHSDEMKAIEARARQLRAEAFSALLSTIGTAIVRLVKAPAHLFARPRAA